MALNLGVHVYERATAVSTPVVAASGIPYFAGAAPVQTATNPAKANVPVLCTSWDEAVEKLGFADDWKKYPLCEAMYSHFQLFGSQPAVFCNVLDPATKKAAVAVREYAVKEHIVSLPMEAIDDNTLKVEIEGDEVDGIAEITTLVKDEDYSVYYSGGNLNIELLNGSDHYGATTVQITYTAVTPATIAVADIVLGVGEVDSCMSMVGVIPDLILTPGWSHNSVVAAIMATKAAGINGLFRAKALIDVDTGADGVREYSALLPYKNNNNLVDENQIVCWPMIKLGEYKFHMATQLAGLMATVDTTNGGCPYESPSNKTFKMDGCILEDGTEVNLKFEQSNIIAEYGIVTALNFMGMGWTCRNNFTACYPGNTDVKDYFIPVSRMFDWAANTLIRTFWSKLDKPMNRRLIDTIIDTCNIWLDGQVGAEHLLGARAVFSEDENPLTDLMAGIIRIHIYMTPPSPAQEIDFTLEYDVNYVTAALAA